MRFSTVVISIIALTLLVTGQAQVTPSSFAPQFGLLAGGGGLRPSEAHMNAHVNLNGTWILKGGTALRPVAGHLPSLTFAGNAVSGTGGCNRLNGTVQVGGSALTFGLLGVTKMMCDRPVNTQEDKFLKFLGQGQLRAQLSGDSLTLTDSNGQTLTFSRSSTAQGNRPAVTTPATAVQGTYTLTSVDGQPAPHIPEAITLTFKGGQLSGNDGCNTFGAPYQLDGQHLMLLGEPVSTLKACPDQPEMVNVPALLAAHPTVKLVGTTLTIQAEGKTLTFTRN